MRLAAMGNQLISDPEVSNFSAVSSDSDKQFVLAMMQAHAENVGSALNLSSFDVVGGFLHIKQTSPIRLFLLIPSNLPHPLAGLYVEIFGALYGLRESNKLFSDELQRVVLTAGFSPCPSSSMTFVASDPDDSDLKCVVSLHVDDGFCLDTCSALADRLFVVLTELLVHLQQSVTFNLSFMLAMRFLDYQMEQYFQLRMVL